MITIKQETLRRGSIKFATYALCIICLLFITVLIKAWLDGNFDSVESFQQYVDGYGAFAPIFLTLFQAAQVIIPVLPGFFGSAVGALMFGAAGGFLCNYIGISGGSIIAFFLARKYGISLVNDLFNMKKYQKWIDKAANSRAYTVSLFLAMLLPLFPDDFLCYFSGLTKMTAKKFIWIIILGKPWCILAYSIGFSFIK